MGGWNDSRRIDDEAKGAFLAGIKRGLCLKDAAREAGFTLGAFWRERRRDPAFNEAVEDALEETADPRYAAPENRRRLQARGMRRLRFVEWRREVFLQHFAGTCNETEAAAAAGVTRETVYRHRIKDPAFAARHQAALEQGYVMLEAVLVRQRLQAQKKVAEALAEGFEPKGEVAEEFERVMKLLARWDRGGGRIGPRRQAHGRREAWTFDEAIDELERYMKALGIPVEDSEPEEGEG